ncbi:MAG: HD domain-containing protein [Ignavibacteriales bacterium]|nr:HD domain-containing protein [Ignavibacteriales bacterium]
MNTNDLITSAKEFITREFQKNSPENNLYHNFEHTLDVVQTAIEIASAMRIGSKDYQELVIAAWFHDIGHFESCHGHEEISAQKVILFLEDFHLPAERINGIVNCIIATKIPQSPTNTIGEILCDADLHHLGTKEFYHKSELLRNEITLKDNCVFSEVEWIQKNIDFLNAHHYFTDYAKRAYGFQKAENLKSLEKSLSYFL